MTTQGVGRRAATVTRSSDARVLRDGAVVAPLALGHPRRQPAATSRRAPEIVWPS